MNPETKPNYWTFNNLRKKGWFWLALGIVALTIYHQDAIRGQWKFERLCKEDAGARFYGKIEKGQGWIVDDRSPSGFGGPFSFEEESSENIAFVRYTNETGEQFDVLKKIGATRSEFVLSPVDQSRPVRYRYKWHQERLGGDDRFSSTTISVIDNQTEALLATFTSYGYSWTKPERVLFAAPTGQTCEMLGYANVDAAKFRKSIFEYGC